MHACIVTSEIEVNDEEYEVEMKGNLNERSAYILRKWPENVSSLWCVLRLRLVILGCPVT